MLSKNLTAKDKEHLARVKALPCGVCGRAAPSSAHHIEQGLHHLCIPLCYDCHQGNHNGIHGSRAMWKVTKKTELSVLNETIKMLTDSQG